VIPAEPDAASSSHNIDFESFESRKSGAAELETRVMPLDRFNNTVPGAQGFAVTIDGGEPVPLVGPAFSYTYMVPAGLSKALKVSFTLDGEEISGSPVFIDVAPDNTVLYLGVTLSLLVLLALVVSIYQRFCSSRIERAEEQVLSIKASLKKSLDGK
jgi:hypothetical protein